MRRLSARRLRAAARALGLAGVLVAAALGGVGKMPEARGQQLGFGMDRSGTVGIQNETERKLFYSLICTCGCPRETLGTCTCGFAHQRRAELREELAKGTSIEAIQAAYVERFGTQALAVPPNEGASRLLWIAPLVAIALGAAGLGTFLVRLRRRSDRLEAQGAGGAGSAGASEATGSKGSVARPARDDYDDRLDDELKRLDE